ncbi:MAG: 50S ribosomal protein L4 [bacterium]|nr:50S ribosomal protein L4 [bacterium]
MKIKTFSLKGTKGEALTLPKEFTGKVNLSVLAQALHIYEIKSHTGFSKVKTRSEVNRTTKKVYKQKGTGGARHGSRRAPIYVGGGVAHGPKIEKRVVSITKKFKILAKNMALSQKSQRGEMVAVSGLSKVEKTKDMNDLLKVFAKGFPKAKKFSFAFSDKNAGVRKTVSNIKNIRVHKFSDLNVLDIYRGGILVLDKDIFEK